MNFVGNSEIQGTLLPFRVPPHIFIIFLSSFSLSLSIFFLVLVHLSWIEKKNHAASFHAPHGTLSFLFFFFFFFGRSPPHVSLFSTPRFGPLCTMGPAQRPATFVFFSLSLSLLFHLWKSVPISEGMVDGRWRKKKFIENLPNRRRIVTMGMWRGRSDGFSTWKTVGRMVIRFLLKGEIFSRMKV